MSDRELAELLKVLASRAFITSNCDTSFQWLKECGFTESECVALSTAIDSTMAGKMRAGALLSPLANWSMAEKTNPQVATSFEDQGTTLQRTPPKFGRKPKQLSPYEIEYVLKRRAEGLGWETIAKEINAIRGIADLPQKDAYERMVSSGSLRRMDREGIFARIGRLLAPEEILALSAVEDIQVEKASSRPMPPLGAASREALRMLAGFSEPVSLHDLYHALAVKSLVPRVESGQISRVAHVFAALKRRGYAERAGPKGTTLIRLTEEGRQAATTELEEHASPS